eukprot:Gregarina_sp_Pseudo_9__5071@NODE_532_length_2631_cov_35_600694_g502_i0_p2_GENE_NODE_532_length_2631_cov_35_600694_g502_i0NODE_532_length_2631_cov_35_600694_g502_i0_p2_ORF_typecomplete_len238_score14_12_NODE_532_length_2631_cov_35_600694_g502_i016462359
MAAWILGGCGANNGAPAFFQCQPTDPYANVEIPDLIPTISVPRIKYVVWPDERKRRNRLYDQYGDELIVEDTNSVTSASVLPTPSGMMYGKRRSSKNSKRTKSPRSQEFVIKIRGDELSDYEDDMEIGPDGLPRRKDGLGAQGGMGVGLGARYDRNGNLLPPPIRPVAEDQVSARSSDRIRSLQALLGGSALTDRYGKPPPLSAPYYQSGALHEAEDDLAPVAVSTPQMMREAAWIH